MVPTVELPPCTPPTLQVALTARLLLVALNCCVAPRPTLMELGDTIKFGGGGVPEPPPPQEISTRRKQQLNAAFIMFLMI
jgi:hypothetical protein